MRNEKEIYFKDNSVSCVFLFCFLSFPAAMEDVCIYFFALKKTLEMLRLSLFFLQHLLLHAVGALGGALLMGNWFLHAAQTAGPNFCFCLFMRERAEPGIYGHFWGEGRFPD